MHRIAELDGKSEHADIAGNHHGQRVASQRRTDLEVIGRQDFDVDTAHIARIARDRLRHKTNPIFPVAIALARNQRGREQENK